MIKKYFKTETANFLEWERKYNIMADLTLLHFEFFPSLHDVSHIELSLDIGESMVAELI